MGLRYSKTIRLFYTPDTLIFVVSINLYHNVHDGHHFHRTAVAVFRIYIILYGDKPDTECREHIVYVLSDFDIVPAKPRKIFYDDGIEDACLCVVQKPLHFRALEGRT